MAFEMTCGQCQGRLQVEQTGVVVACPHCGTHLNIAASPTEPATTPPPSASETAAVPEPPPQVEPPQVEPPQVEPPQVEPPQVEPPPVESPPVESPPVESPQVESPQVESPQVESPQVEPAGDPESATGGESFSGLDTVSESAVQFPPILPDQTESESFEGVTTTVDEMFPVLTDSADSTVSDLPIQEEREPVSSEESSLASPFPADEAPVETEAETVLVQPEPAAPQTPVSSQPPATAPSPTPAQSDSPGIPRPLFFAVASYASAVTIAAVYLFLQQNNPSSSQLQHMPDVKPQRRKEQIAYPLAAEDQKLPPGYTLALGEERRYGNLLVKPVRVTRGPIEFVDHLGEENGRTRPPGPEVVKLWLKITNVSADQRIAPLEELVFRREVTKGSDRDRSNNFVCRESQKKKDGRLILVYDLNLNDVWNLRDQHVGKALDPGETIETYIPTTADGVEELTKSDEPLVWRVHFRKGFSPKRYGVTTLIEVNFDSSDIKPEQA